MALACGDAEELAFRLPAALLDAAGAATRAIAGVVAVAGVVTGAAAGAVAGGTACDVPVIIMMIASALCGSAHDASGTMPMSGSATTCAAGMSWSAPRSSARMRATLSRIQDMAADLSINPRRMSDASSVEARDRHL